MNLENIKQYTTEKEKVEVFNNTATFEVLASRLEEVVGDLKNKQGLSLKLITATDERAENGCFKIWYVFGLPEENAFIVPFIKLQNITEFPSVVSKIPEAVNYERRIMSFFGLLPVGNPDQRSIILHENWPADVYPLRKDFVWNTRPKEATGNYEFQKIEKEGIYEIPVGPIHAGIIEPGHFRFSVLGEEIINLEARLGFVHKGSEKMFEILPTLEEKVHLSEKISGDSSFSHSLAFCNAIEQLSNTQLSKRAEYLRVIFAELERLANHFGDIGAMMLDTGFNFGGAQGSRLREMVMQINERLTESRFLRGVNTIGGVNKDISTEERKKLSIDLMNIEKDFSEIVAIAENSTSLRNRLKTTGRLSLAAALEKGGLGVPVRALGIKCDTRVNFPYAAYSELGFNQIETENDGDANARFRVRLKEISASINLIAKALDQMPDGVTNVKKIGVLQKKSIAISVVEGWRGEIVYFVTTDKLGNIQRVAPRDPSFINWSLLGCAGLENIVPDFPLINKSFNLSYTGNDL